MKERLEGEYPMKKWIGRMAVLLALLMAGAYLPVRDAACISYRNYGSGSEGPDNEIVGKGYRRLLEKEFQPYECTAPAL